MRGHLGLPARLLCPAGFRTKHAKQHSPNAFPYIVANFNLTELTPNLLLGQAPRPSAIRCHIYNQLYFGSLNTQVKPLVTSWAGCERLSMASYSEALTPWPPLQGTGWPRCRPRGSSSLAEQPGGSVMLRVWRAEVHPGPAQGSCLPPQGKAKGSARRGAAMRKRRAVGGRPRRRRPVGLPYLEP